MTSPGDARVAIPVDVLAIRTDLHQQIADITGIVATRQRTVRELWVILQPPSQSQSKAQAPAVRQPPSGAAPSAAASSALRSARDVPVVA